MLNGVNEGIYIVDEPLPLDEATVGETRPDLVSLMRRKSGVDSLRSGLMSSSGVIIILDY